MLVLSPNLLLAQSKDSIVYKKNTVYIIGGLQIGAGFGEINKLSSDPTGQSGGICAGASFELLRNHNFMEAEVYGYAPFSFDAAGFQSYQLSLGRQLPLGEEYSFSLSAGISFDEFSYDGPYTTHTNGSAGFFSGYYPAEHTSAIGVPLEVKYNFIKTHVLGGSIAYGINLNNKVVVSTLTVNILVGKLREKKPNDKKLIRLF